MPNQRSTSQRQRERVIAAALDVFAQRGYAGTSTDRVAREAGLSQPYVVRLFGSKLSLFCQVLDHAWDRARADIEAGAGEPSNAALHPAARNHLRLLLHGATAAAAEPEVRTRFLGQLDRTAEELGNAGLDPDQARDMLAKLALEAVFAALEVP